MKKITNKEVQISMLAEDNTPKKMTRAEILKIVINYVDPKQGVTIVDMRQGLTVWGKLDTAKDLDIELEDAEFTFLKQKFDSFKWATVHKDIVELADHVEEVLKQK